MKSVTKTNTIIGTITQSRTEPKGDEQTIRITIPYTLQTDSKTITIPHQIIFWRVPKERWQDFQTGNLVKVDIKLFWEDIYFVLEGKSLTVLGEDYDGPVSQVVNQLTGTITQVINRFDEDTDTAYTSIVVLDIVVPYKFTWVDLPEDQKYRYRVGDVVTADYHFKDFFGVYHIRYGAKMTHHCPSAPAE